MERDISTERIIIDEKPISFGRTYITSFPGIVRLLNVIFGLLALILVLPGFANDFIEEDLADRYERLRDRHPHYRYTYDGRFEAFEHHYGAGYVAEGQNVIQLICIVICLVFSGGYLYILVTSPGLHSGASREWNRFLNLSASIIHGVGFLNGVFGVLVFRSYCCHVEFNSNERHESELEGYFRESCLCYFTPKWEGHVADRNEYTTLYYRDVPDDIDFHRALPHHFIPHTISLCFMGMNVVAFILASLKT